jgi:hypothetical protein
LVARDQKANKRYQRNYIRGGLYRSQRRRELALNRQKKRVSVPYEQKIAAARTSVSSVLSFFAEQLRCRLFEKDQKQIAEETASPAITQTGTGPLTGEQIRACPDCGGSGLSLARSL